MFFCLKILAGAIRPAQVVVFTLAMAVSTAVISPAAARNVSDNFDRTKGERSISYIADGSTDLALPVVTFSANFTGEEQSSSISLAFVTNAQDDGPARSRFAGCHDVEWFADGQTVAAGPVVYGGRVIDGEMVEWIDQDVTPQWVAAMGAAGIAHYRVCKSQYMLTASDIEAFSLISTKLRNAAMASGAVRGRSPAAAPANKVEYQGMNWRPRNP